MPRRGRRALTATLSVVLVLLTAAGALVWFGQRSQMYYPDRSAVPRADDALPGSRDVTLTTADGLELAGWYAPPTGECDAAVLVAPGNGGNRSARVALAEAIRGAGFGVLLWDYRGYASNEGSPSEEGLALDARAARDLLDSQGPAHVVYLGESLGTGVVTELATERPPAALVLRSPYTTFGDVADALLGAPVGWMLRDRYPLVEHLDEVEAPVAVVFGTADSLVPAEQSRRVAQVARDGGLEVVEVPVDGADHNDDVLAAGRPLVDALVRAARLGGVQGCGPAGG